jgi:hypothetical protein
MNETAKCRGCGKILKGKPYHLGRSYVTDPATKKQVKESFYGGYVCSYTCDYESCLKMQNSSGAGYISHLINTEYLQNWNDDLKEIGLSNE